MSTTLEASLKLEIAAYQASLARASKDAVKFKEDLKRNSADMASAALGKPETWHSHRASMTAMAREMNSFKSSSRGIQLGGVAMQAQDIAVQLQMGTKASIVLAQQGSQILSYFGASGAIVGGALAIGGALYSSAEKSREAFNLMKAEGDGFAENMKRALTGTSSEITAFFSEVRGGVTAAYGEIERLNSGAGGIMARITAAMGGPSVTEREQTANSLALQKAQALEVIQRSLLDVSAQETRVAELKAAGQNKAAEALQRQLTLQRDLAAIQASSLPGNIKTQLSADASERSRLAGVEIIDPQKEKDRQAALRALKKDAAGAAMNMLPDAERLPALRAQLQSLMTDAQMRNIGTPVKSVADMGRLAAGSKFAAPVEDYKKALEIQREITSLEKAAADKQAADNKNSARVQEARAVMDIEMQIVREQAQSGDLDNAKIAAFKDQLNVLQLSEQIQNQLRLTESDALKMAREKVSLERTAASISKDKLQARSLQDLEAEMQIESLRAAGKNKQADAQERMMRVTREARSMESMGIDSTRARTMAETRIANQERIAGAGDSDTRGGRRKILGFTPGQEWRGATLSAAARGGGGLGGSNGRRSFGSLADYDAMQTAPSQYDLLQQRGRGGLDAMHVNNAAKSNPDTKVAEMLGKLLEATVRGFFGA